jgi:hypothetical protein
MRKIYLTSLLLIVLATTIYAQKPASFIVTKTSKGVNITSMKSNPPFQFDVKGTVVKQLQSRDDGVLLKVDGTIINVLITKVITVIKTQKITDEEKLLKAHQKWELDFQSSFLFQKPLTVEAEESVVLNLFNKQQQRSLFWYFKCPPTKGSEEDRRAMQVTKIGDTFLALGSPLTPKDSLPERRKLLKEILSSIIGSAK